MSLFVFQQKIPFQSVIRWLRYLEPSSDMAPEAWAKLHVADVAPGDILFVWEVMYSPWGDSSTGIGVADGDSFRVSQLFFVTKWEGGKPAGFCVSQDTYEKHSVFSYFENCANNAKQNGVGYYYSIVRSNPGLTPDKLAMLDTMDSYGVQGWRADEGRADLPYTFFQHAGYGVEARTGMVLPIDQLGYALFCDKDPPPGGPIPDIRRFTAPVFKDTHRATESAPAAPEPAAVEQPSAMPKRPSFFNQLSSSLGAAIPAFGRQQEPAAPTAPTKAEMLAPIAKSDPPPSFAEPEPETPAAPAAQMWGLDEEVAPEPAPQSEPEISESSDGPTDEQVQQAWAAIEAGDNAGENEPAAEEAPPVEAPEPPATPEPAPPVAPPVIPPIASSSIPPMPSYMEVALPPQPVGQAATEPDAPEPVAEVSSRPDLKITQDTSEALEPAKSPGVEDIMAAIETSIRETAEAKKQESKAEPTSTGRPRPGRIQISQLQQQQQQQPEPEQAQPEPVVAQPVAETGDAGGDIPPGPPKKKKPDPADVARAQEMQNRAQLKEPVAVKSGVAGLVSKLEQQASKASARLETQVEDIQGRLTDELNRLLGKVNTSEKRSAKSAEGLRINLTGKMDGVANGVKSQISESTAAGISNIQAHDEGGSQQLDEKHEYLRTSLTGSFDEVKARAQTVAKSFEETLNADAKQVLSALAELQSQWQAQFDEIETQYLDVLEASLSNFKDHLNVLTASATGVVSDRHVVFDAQLADLRTRQLKSLEHTRSMLLSKLGKKFVNAETELLRLQTNALEETLLPKLKQHREELRVVTTEFQHKLSQDLDEKGETKIAEVQPILDEKKEKLMELLKETTTVKDTIQEQLRAKLEAIFTELKEFVEKGIDEAETAFKSTEEQLAEIDRDIRALADPSTIEGDIELLNERNSVLARLDEVTETSKENVTNTLRSNLAALEERGKSLQEELISSMEEDAYVVRRASEQALVAIREAVRDSFVAIQAAQDERMPM